MKPYKRFNLYVLPFGEIQNNESDVSGKLFCRWVHRFLTLGVGSEFASDRLSSSSLFISSHDHYMVLELAAGLFP